MGRWDCVELRYEFAGSGAGRIQMLVNDAPVVDVAPVYPAAMFREIQVGVTRAGDFGSQVFVDDVVIATQPIGCS